MPLVSIEAKLTLQEFDFEYGHVIATGTGIGVAPSNGVAAAPGAGLTYTPSTGRGGSNIYGSSGTQSQSAGTSSYPAYSSFTPASSAAGQAPRCLPFTCFLCTISHKQPAAHSA